MFLHLTRVCAACAAARTFPAICHSTWYSPAESPTSVRRIGDSRPSWEEAYLGFLERNTNTNTSKSTDRQFPSFFGGVGARRRLLLPNTTPHCKHCTVWYVSVCSTVYVQYQHFCWSLPLSPCLLVSFCPSTTSFYVLGGEGGKHSAAFN